jgi:hypothetical protein
MALLKKILFVEEERPASPEMSRSVTLVKGKNNMIGISIGGGAPMCPVLYVVQVRQLKATPTELELIKRRTYKLLTTHPCLVSLATPLTQAEGFGAHAYNDSCQYCCVLLMGHEHCTHIVWGKWNEFLCARPPDPSA